MSGCSIRSWWARNLGETPGVVLLAALLALCVPAQAAAEWQIKPFIGLTFGGTTTFNDPELAAGKSHLVFGAAAALIGEVFGVEGDFGQVPGSFQTGDQELVISSSTRSITGNVVIAWPRRLTEYTLRPYFVGGVGVMRVVIEDNRLLGQVQVSDRVAAVDIGGGATGFITNRMGVSWDVRHFRSVGSAPGIFLLEDGQLSFWRANMSVVVRY